jgi:hypothetical protein
LWRTDTTSIRRWSRAVPAASSASPRVAGGTTFVGARTAATSVVATRRRRSMPLTTRLPSDIQWSKATSLARIGSGTTRRAGTSTDRSWRRRTIIPSTNPYRDRPVGYPPVGSASSIDGRPDRCGRDSVKAGGRPSWRREPPRSSSGCSGQPCRGTRCPSSGPHRRSERTRGSGRRSATATRSDTARRG